MGGDTWQDAGGRRWRYSSGNDSILLLSRPARRFGSADELEDFFASKLVGAFGLRVAGESGGRYELELDDESRLDLVRHAAREFGGERFLSPQPCNRAGPDAPCSTRQA